MENEIIKKPRGRPRILTDEQRKQNKTRYMLNTAWYCQYCYPIINYTLAGKSCHIKTKKHKKYANIYNKLMSITTGEIIHKQIM